MESMDIFNKTKDTVSSLIDFSECNLIDISLGGAMDKLVVKYNKKLYILKFNQEGNSTTVSEYIASRIAQALAIPCQRVLLGVYNGRDCCAIEYFLKGQEKLHAYKEINNSSLSNSFNKDIRNLPYNLEDIIEVITNYKSLNIPISERLKAFEMMCYFDTLIGNFDRHWGNWGFIGNNKDYRLAPLFDNGSSLFPKRQITGVTKLLNSKQELLKRVYAFPTSAIKKLDTKYLYKELILDMQRLLETNSLAIFCKSMDKINLEVLLKEDVILKEVLEKEDLDFIVTIIKLRYKLLLREVWINATL